LSIPAQLQRRAGELLAANAAAASRLRVEWMGLDESVAMLGDRLAALRRETSARILVAVPYGTPVPPGFQAVPFTAKMFRLLHPSVFSRYRVGSGGRGSGKSHAFATAIVLYVLAGKRRVLCAREIMRSLRESSHHLLCEKIDAFGLAPFFNVTDRSIECLSTGSEIIFAGLWANINTLKSIENISLVWIEESESVSARSIEVLSPSIRAHRSEIWLSCNPTDADAVVQSFINGQRPNVRHGHVIYSDNPWFGETALEDERAYMERVDPDLYRHVWLGEVRRVSDAIVFAKKWTVEEFEPSPDWPTYQGLDFGFSGDPSAALRCHVNDRTLLVSHEFWGLRVELDVLSHLIETAIPGSRQSAIYCDCSRPESIAFLAKHGHPFAVAAPKWSGSIMDGISFLRSFEVIKVHPRCVRLIDELRSYSYKIDRLTGLPLVEPEDRNNHLIDSLRYAVSNLIRRQGGEGLLAFAQSELAAFNGEAQKQRDRQNMPGTRITSVSFTGWPK